MSQIKDILYGIAPKMKFKKQAKAHYGKKPSLHYFAGDMANIRAYFDYCQKNNPDSFFIDEITWNDLNMDEIYKRINQGLSTSGEQYLYYMLRDPAVDEAEYDRRKTLIEFMENNSAFRLKLQTIFFKLGRSRRADICNAFSPKQNAHFMLPVYLVLSIAFIAAIVCMLLKIIPLGYMFILLIINPLVHSLMKGKIEWDLATINYSVSMVYTAKKIQDLKNPPLDAVLKPMYESLNNLRGILRTGGLSTSSADNIVEMINSFLLLDLITYEYLKNKLARCHDDIFMVHKFLGMVDSAIAVASYRQSVEVYTIPYIDFSDEGSSFFEVFDLRHPLIDNPVSNSIDMEKPILLTGSNASGKSTFLKAAAINAILAQSICTALCSSYASNPFYIFSSMAISDNLSAGDSYYIAEIKSLKRIMDFSAANKRIFCVVDEVLRGTNTIERIAASSEILSALSDANVLCIAATHDLELCGLLSGNYAMYHFEEQIQDNEIYFDYILKDGPATSRNAIKLLRIMGLSEDIVLNAENRAEKYSQSGIWDN